MLHERTLAKIDSPSVQRKGILMKVLVTGANGFIASSIVESLLLANHDVIACARSNTNLPTHVNLTYQHLDFNLPSSNAEYEKMLAGVDIVMNCAGILREKQPGDFTQVHVDGPLRLAQAAENAGVKKFIQLSALGNDSDGAFINSKHELDEKLLLLRLPVTIIRPSVVVSTHGSYGGTSMLRAMASLPLLLAIPGSGRQKIQPILLADVVEIFIAAMSRSQADNKVLYAVGSEVLTLMQFLTVTRQWLKIKPTWLMTVPMFLLRPIIAIADKYGRGPINKTILTMLENGNVAPKDASQELQSATGLVPQSVTQRLSCAPSFVQDRWHARLYLLRLPLWISVSVVWIISAVAGAYAEPHEFRPILDSIGVATDWQQMTVFLMSLLDCILGVMLLFRYRVKLVLWLMLISVVGYTAVIGASMPMLWFLPMGGLAKNIVLIPSLIILMTTENHR